MADATMAKQMYRRLCSALEREGLKYLTTEENLSVLLNFEYADAMPVQIILYINPQMLTLHAMSKLPFPMRESKRLDGALAANVLSRDLYSGCFTVNINDGSVLFTMAECFRDGLLEESLICRMIALTCSAVKMHGKTFLDLDQGELGISELIQK